MKNRSISKLAVSALIVSSLAGSPVYAELGSSPAVSASNTVKLKFPDISSTHWATRFISMLAVEGVIEGYEDGSYRAENSVSQQDVIIMAIRMMGLEDQVKAYKATAVFPDFLLIDDYARNYIAVALEKGLITLPEEKALSAVTSSKVTWGKREATREWVAKIAIRAIGQQDVADTLGSNPTTFKDNSDISFNSLGYVNAAVKLNIVNGFEDGSFQPKGKVTRAQMAAFLSRSQKESKSLPSRVVKGYVTGLTTNTISIEDKAGESHTYSLSNDVVFYGNKDDNKINPSTIQQTYEVSIVQVGGSAYFVEVLKDELQMDVYEGTLVAAYIDKMSLTLFSNNRYDNYDLSQDVAVTDADGRGLSFSSLEKGSLIELRKSKLSKIPKITQIIVKQVPINKTSEGTIQSILKDSNKIQILETATNKSETLNLSSKLITVYGDNSLADLNALHAGDTISYEVVNSEVAKIVIKKQADIGISVEGKLTSLSSDKTIVTITKTVGGKLGSYFLGNNVLVQIDGLASASIYDLEVDDILKLDVLNDVVTKITVTNRSIKNVYFTKIISYDAASKGLFVQDDAGNLGAYKLADTTPLWVNGSQIPFTSFSSFFSAGKRVDLKVSKDKVTYIQLSSQLDGVITQLNLQTNDFTIRAGNGQSMNFKIIYAPQVEIPNKTTSTTADLKIGDPVNLTLSFDQTFVSKVAVTKTLLMKTLIVNNATKQITVSDDSNTNYVYSLDGIPLVNENQSTATIADIALDEYVKLTFKGTTLTKGELVTPLRGKVTAIDTASTSITVEDFTGNNKVIALGSNYAVKQNGGSNLAFSSIKVGDRVMIMKDPTDKMLIQVAFTSQRTLSAYEYLLNRMIFSPASAGEKQVYNLYPKAYYHKGTQALTANSFVANDIVKIYVLDDKIVEMEKQ
jgi:hypothetical protein